MVSHFDLGNFTTDAGETIENAQIAYKTWGDPSYPCIVYPTWFSGYISDNEYLIDIGTFDLDKYFVIVPALFGNSQSSSPSNYAPGRDKFPFTSMSDNVRAQHQLVTSFGITKIHAVLGWSMGAAQSFQWAVQFPDMVERIVPFCGSARTSLHNITFLDSLALSIQLHPNYDTYKTPDDIKSGLHAFSVIYSSWGLNQAFYRAKLFTEMTDDKGNPFDSLESFIAGFWDPLFAKKSPHDLCHHLKTWRESDITRTKGRPFTSSAATRSDDKAFSDALASIKAKSLVMPCKQDLYFPPEDSEIEVAHIPDATLSVIDSKYGHFAGGPIGKQALQFIKMKISAFLEQ